MRIAGRTLRGNALIGAGIVGLLLLTVLVGLVWTPYDPLGIDLDAVLAPPSVAHWFGTDEFGRDVLSRAMVGARISTLIALGVVVISLPLGIAAAIYLEEYAPRNRVTNLIELNIRNLAGVPSTISRALVAATT